MLENRLQALADPVYKEFHRKLIPTVDPDTILGVRTPQLRRFAKDFAKTPEAFVFLCTLPHICYEENNVHGFLIEEMKNFDDAVDALNKFLPHIDNWATCDMISPKAFRNKQKELYPHILQWLRSDHTYTIRFAIEMLMKYYLEDHFEDAHLNLVSSLRSEEYYVNMMISWYFATALTKQYEATLPYLETPHMDIWTHNKAIQKAIESRRITPEQKAYLRTLKIKMPIRRSS